MEHAAGSKIPEVTGTMLSLRLKIILSFLLVGSVMTALLSVAVYRVLDVGLLRQMQGRVLDLAQLAAQLVDTGVLQRLSSRLSDGLSDGLSDADVDRAETSPDYRTVSDTLNRVRAVESRLVHYIYTFAPTSHADRARYVVDADVLAARAEKAAGKDVGDISHFSSEFDISDYPVARKALSDRMALVEDTWSWDPDFKVNSITGYAPLFTKNGVFVGVVGIDMVDTDVRKILSQATTVMLAVLVGALVLTTTMSILLGTLFTRGIMRLDRVVRAFDEAHMDVRAPVRSRDEVGRLSASFNGMAATIQRYHARQEELLRAYGRFVPHELLRLLDKGSILEVKLGDQTQKEMAVLFSDIRSFTRMSEKMTPFENFNFINSYLRRMGPHIRAHGGIIDKYIGDAIMALFPLGAADALDAAIAMRVELREYNIHRTKSGYEPIDIGVGVNAGKLMVGTVGEHERMDGSVIADAVNLCSRLEALTRVYGTTILTTGRTLKSLPPDRRFLSRFVDRVRVRGRREAVLVFEVLDGEMDETLARRMSYRPTLAAAQRMYFRQRFREALEIFADLVEAHPGDPLPWIYRERCQGLVRDGALDSWKGVEEIDVG